MSFAINPSLSHIDLSEANILMIYRSKGQVQLADARFRNHPCEAFICIYRVDKTVSAQVALFETVMNSIFVYTSDFSADQNHDYPKVLAEAQSFTSSFGFAMEKVNLDFSPAMREVIIKGINVMRPPKKRVKLRSLSNLEPLDIGAPEPSGSTTPPPTVSPETKPAEPRAAKSLSIELSSAKTLIEKITREKVALEQSTSREIAALKAAAEKAAEAKKSCELRLTKEIESLRAEHLAAASEQKDERIEQLEKARDEAELSATALSEKLSRLTGEIEVMANEKLQLEQQLSTEKSSSSGTILKLTAEIDAKNAQLTTEKNLAADKIATLALFETSWRESQQREEDLHRDLELMQKKLGLLEADLEKYRLDEKNEEALLLKIAALEKEVEASRSEIKKRAGSEPELDALKTEIKSLAEAKNDIESEYIRMANEVMEKEAETLEHLYKADAEILRLTRELEQQQGAKMEAAALRDEIKLLLESGVSPPSPGEDVRQEEVTNVAPTHRPVEVSEAPIAVPLEPKPSPQPAAVGKAPTAPPQPEVHPVPDMDVTEEETPDEPVAGEPEITQGLLNEFGSFCGSSGLSTTEFKIDPAISAVEYSDPAEVVAILYSSNSVQAIPDGTTAQRCKGYVLATHRSGEYRTYVAWYLMESQKVVVCVPEQQPVDAMECTQFLADAITYFEVVGLMMELEDLGNTARSYNSAIRKVPVLVKK